MVSSDHTTSVVPAPSDGTLQQQAKGESTSGPVGVQTTAGSTTGKKEKHSVAPQTSTMGHTQLQSPYSATGHVPVQNYYAWQSQSPYTYQPFQHPLPQAVQPTHNQPPNSQTKSPVSQHIHSQVTESGNGQPPQSRTPVQQHSPSSAQATTSPPN